MFKKYIPIPHTQKHIDTLDRSICPLNPDSSSEKFLWTTIPFLRLLAPCFSDTPIQFSRPFVPSLLPIVSLPSLVYPIVSFKKSRNNMTGTLCWLSPSSSVKYRRLWTGHSLPSSLTCNHSPMSPTVFPQCTIPHIHWEFFTSTSLCMPFPYL